jgi:hypothetical protein
VYCGRPVDSNRGAPRYQESPAAQRGYEPPPEREPGPPRGRDYAPPPARGAPSVRDYPQQLPNRDYPPPRGRDYEPPPGRDFAPPPEREGRGGFNPNTPGRPVRENEARFQPPIRGRDGEPFCPRRDDTIQDGLCKPYIGR